MGCAKSIPKSAPSFTVGYANSILESASTVAMARRGSQSCFTGLEQGKHIDKANVELSDVELSACNWCAV